MSTKRTYSEPMRRLHPQGAATTTVHGKRKRCYVGWFCRWYESNDKRGWIHVGDDIESARTEKKRLEEEEEQGTRGVVQETPKSFKEAAAEFLLHRRSDLVPGSKPPTEEEGWKGEPTRYLEELHRRLDLLAKASAFDGKPMTGIGPAEVDAYFDAREGGGPKTRNEDLMILRQLFRWAQKRGYAHMDPTDGKKRKKLPRRKPRILSREEEERLLEACREKYKIKGIEGARNIGSRKGKVSAVKKGLTWSQEFTPPPWLHPMVLIALRTALRLGNIAGLRWGHVDLKKGTMHIPAEDMKNDSDLEIPLHPEVKALLQSLRQKAEHIPNDDALVLSAASKTIPDRFSVRKAFRHACARSGIKPAIRFHSLRKTAASRMLESGAHLKTVMEVGGWNDPGVLLKLYAVASDEEKRKAVAAL